MAGFRPIKLSNSARNREVPFSCKGADGTFLYVDGEGRVFRRADNAWVLISGSAEGKYEEFRMLKVACYDATHIFGAQFSLDYSILTWNAFV